MLVARTRRKKKENNVVALRSFLNVFACGQVSSPRLYRLKENVANNSSFRRQNNPPVRIITIQNRHTRMNFAQNNPTVVPRYKNYENLLETRKSSHLQ